MKQNTLTTQWLTQSEAARRLGVSREAVRQAIAARRIEWNGKRGHDCRVRGDLLPARTLPPLTRAPKTTARRTGSSSANAADQSAPKGSAAPKGPITPKGPASAPKAPAAHKSSAAFTPADQLIDARLRKLESDIALQTMRLESHRSEIYNQALSDFRAAYEASFTPLKKFLLSLDLPAETLQRLAQIADDCEQDFQSKITG